MPHHYDNANAAVDAIIEAVGHDIRIGLPLGLGKPVELVNALYARARENNRLQLTILTALSLEKPRPAPGLEAALLTPFLERVYADAPALSYLEDLRRNTLPPNVRLREFFFMPGSRLRVPRAQQDYVCSNYTHAARDVFAQGCNVVAQIVARREGPEGVELSLSCNPDTGPELTRMLREAGRRFVSVAQVHPRLPFMGREAAVPESEFDLVLAGPDFDKRLFSTPKQPVGDVEHAIGMHASALIRDGGTLQIGIGALGDAIVAATCMRHRDNALYQRLQQEWGTPAEQADLLAEHGGLEPFSAGVYGATEMFVDGFLELYACGILKRRVYDDEHLQTLINQGRVDPDALTPALLDGLEALGERVIRTHEFETLQRHGVFRDDCRYELGHIIAPNGERIMANLAIPESREALKRHCLGDKLRDGVVLHGGFFLGPNSMYETLNAMPQAERDLFSMQGVEKINQLDANPALYKAQRIHARFINTGIMATTLGAVVSDALDDGRLISGVGGQYNFVAQAHHLLTGRSILMVRSHRGQGADAQSNIVHNYGHCTIPRHLRDILITEYGIADLRSQTDAECIRRTLRISDARFQDALLAQAKAANKIDASFTIPDAWRRNTPERLAQWLAPGRSAGAFARFPFGTELTEQEQALGAALTRLKARSESTPRWKLMLAALRAPSQPADAQAQAALERLQLSQPQGLAEHITRRLFLQEWSRAAA